MKTKLTFKFNDKKIILTKGDKESIDHITLKILAYIMFSQFDKNMAIEKRVDEKYKPDLLGWDNKSKVQIWIECGKTSLDKIEKILRSNSHRNIYILKKNKKKILALQKELKKRFVRSKRIKLIAFENNFVNLISNNLTRQNWLTYYHKSNQLFINLNGKKLKTKPIELS